MGLALRGGRNQKLASKIFDARSDQITTRISEVLGIDFPVRSFRKKKKLAGEDPLDPPTICTSTASEIEKS